MSIFTLANKNSDEFQTTVFQAGDFGSEEAVAAFTNESSAEKYLEETEWGNQYTVAELQDADFMIWLADAHRGGVRYLVVNPQRSLQLEGRRLTTLEIEPHLAEAAAKIERLMRDDV